MRTPILCGIALLLLSGCGESSVTDRVDRLLEGDASYVHSTLPSPARMAELHPDGGSDWSSVTSDVEQRLRKNADGRALLDAGDSAVAELIRLLGDEERRTLAAVVLAEIGGKAGASGLLKQWRSLRGARLKKQTYVHLEDPAKPNARSMAAGFHYDGVDTKYYGELLHALSYCGLPVSAAIAADTTAAIDESEKLLAAGENLSGEQRYDETDVGSHGRTQRWSIGPVQTADEGLQILAMIGAPEAPRLFVRALGSPVRGVRYPAVQNAGYLGEAAAQLVPALWTILDEPRLRGEAAQALSEILGQPRLQPPSAAEEWDAWRKSAKKRFRELGHLPR